jgi:nicotinamidase-related amidase
MAKTLLELSGATPPPLDLARSVLILIDYQNEYLEGPLRLTGAEEAIGQMAGALAKARNARSRIIHVAHNGGPSKPFDRTTHRGQIVDALQPVAGDAVIEKPRPNAFSGTDLAEQIGPAGTSLIIAGFMTHMCVSSTARAALDLGYPVTVLGDACATRDLPSGNGEISAADIHRAELAALADRFAWIISAAEVDKREGERAM